jgi:hypothetical protein
MSFHALGDSGKSPGSAEEWVADAMTKDYTLASPAKCPAFLFHLGDVIYGHHKDQSYRNEFYEPYMHYPGKIIAIPGNHDGEEFIETDPDSLSAFQANFCAPSQTVPKIAGSIFRETMNQPAVYWLLDAPFVQIVGLYSNAAENPGFISGDIPGDAQAKWLLETLQAVVKSRAGGARKALVIATHHPPFTSGGHSPSTEMLAEIDAACNQAGIMPDLFLSGHAHNYQRYTRYVKQGNRNLEIPYIVAGTGGFSEQKPQQATKQRIDDHVFEASYEGYGYLLVTVTAARITMKYVTVAKDQVAELETAILDLRMSKML